MGIIFSSNKKYTRLETNTLEETVFGCYTEVSSLAKNAKIDSVTDETFGEAINLIKPTQPNTDSTDINQEEGNNDGWIVKRHETQARVTISLCHTSLIHGFDIDTTGFTNSCPTQALIEGYRNSDKDNTAMWVPLVEEEPLTENSHNFFQIAESDLAYSQVRLTVSPGGGIARFRTFGSIIPNLSDATKEYNLTSGNHGARIVHWSDTEHANQPNVLLDNGTLTTHGWLTLRSREQSRNDFIVIQLAVPGKLNSIVVDTAGFKGNSPMKIRVEACDTQEDDPYQDVYTQWIPLVPDSAVTENTLNTFLVHFKDTVTHVRLTLLPDGGLQQILCYGFIKQKNTTKSLTNGPNEVHPSFTSHSSADTAVNENKVVTNEAEVTEKNEDNSIIDKPAIAELNVCNTSLSPPTPPPTIDAYKEQPTLSITDPNLHEKMIMEELNGSTTQLLTPGTEKVTMIGNKNENASEDMHELLESEKPAIEQLNATNIQLLPPSYTQANATSNMTDINQSNATSSSHVAAPQVASSETSDALEEDMFITKARPFMSKSSPLKRQYAFIEYMELDKIEVIGGKRKADVSDIDDEASERSKTRTKKRAVEKSAVSTRRSLRSSKRS